MIARTVKGKGLPFAENNFAFHNGMMSSEQFHAALAEIEQAIAEIRRED